MEDEQKYVIIVAGGSGKRMGSDLPKQFIEVAGKPILMHTIEQFYRYASSITIILVLPEDQHNYWNELLIKYNFNISHTVVCGGKERFHSVKNGMTKCSEQGLIAVHDGVRPLVSQSTIRQCFAAASKQKAVVPAIPANESIRKVVDGKNTALDRSQYYMIQTPQVFNSKLLYKAYEQDFSPLFTDDASVVEAMGQTVTLVEGNAENIKITRPMDLKIAEVLLKV